MAQKDDKLNIGVSAIMFGCALLMIPLTAGVVLLTQLSRSDKQIGASAPTTNKCDVDGSGAVDNADYEVAVNGFGRVTPEGDNSKFDFDGDGWINTADLDAITTNSALCTK